jgi:F0F1-type ATP synthase assembly protein I
VKNVKQIVIRSIGLFLATFFGGTAIGAIGGDWLFGTLVGVGTAFAVVLTMIGVSVAWNGTLNSAAITNSFRAAVAKQAEDNDQIRDALEVTEDGDFDFSDLDDSDPELYR